MLHHLGWEIPFVKQSLSRCSVLCRLKIFWHWLLFFTTKKQAFKIILLFSAKKLLKMLKTYINRVGDVT